MNRPAPWKVAHDAKHPPKPKPIKWLRQSREKRTKPATWTTVKGAQSAHNAPEPPRRRIRRESKSKARENRLYAPLARQHKIDHPFCEACGSRGIFPPRPTEHTHHKKGRGRYLLVVEFFLAVCSECHAFIDANRAWAYEIGFLIRRIDLKPAQTKVESADKTKYETDHAEAAASKVLLQKSQSDAPLGSGG